MHYIALQCNAMFKAIIIAIRININIVRAKAKHGKYVCLSYGFKWNGATSSHFHRTPYNVRRVGARMACDAISMTLFGLVWFHAFCWTIYLHKGINFNLEMWNQIWCAERVCKSEWQRANSVHTVLCFRGGELPIGGGIACVLFFRAQDCVRKDFYER